MNKICDANIIALLFYMKLLAVLELIVLTFNLENIVLSHLLLIGRWERENQLPRK